MSQLEPFRFPPILSWFSFLSFLCKWLEIKRFSLLLLFSCCWFAICMMFWKDHWTRRQKTGIFVQGWCSLVVRACGRGTVLVLRLLRCFVLSPWANGGVDTRISLSPGPYPSPHDFHPLYRWAHFHKHTENTLKCLLLMPASRGKKIMSFHLCVHSNAPTPNLGPPGAEPWCLVGYRWMFVPLSNYF